MTEQNNEKLWKYWNTEIEIAQADHEQYFKRVDEIGDRYTDRSSSGRGRKSTVNRFHIFWSQIQTARPIVYANTPVPVVERRFGDADPVARYASELVERCLLFQLSDGRYDATMRLCRDDYLVTARGISWIRYEPKFNIEMLQVSDDSPETGDEGLQFEDGTEYLGPKEDVKTNDEGDYFVEELDFEETIVDWIHPHDFLTSSARTWEEVRWVGRRVYLDKEEFEQRFDKVDIDKVQFTHTPKRVAQRKDLNETERTQWKKAVVWEVWDKPSGNVFWFCEGYKAGMLDVKADFLNLSSFFPCPPCLQSTQSNESYIPIPDFVFIQDQLRELNTLTARISVLSKALKLTGCYDATNKELKRMIREGTDTLLIPVKDWAGFNQRGGLQGGVQWMPITEVSEVLLRCYDMRDRVKADLYEITGFSDLMRGSSDARVTATAEGIKGNFSTMRLQDKQRAMADFSRDTLAKMAEIIAEQFSPETIAHMAGVQFMDNGMLPEDFLAAIQLLKTDWMRDFRLDVETDSTIAVDKAREKEQAIEFTSTVGQTVRTFMELGPQGVEMAPLFREMLLHVARRMDGGRNLEQGIEQSTAGMIQRMQEQANQPPPPSETEKIIQMQAQIAQQQIQLDAFSAQASQQLKAQDQQADQALKQQDQQFEQQLDLQEAQAEIALKREEMMMDAQVDRENAQLKAQTDLMTATLEKPVPSPQQVVAPFTRGLT